MPKNIYVLSDLHGHYQIFLEMLKKISDALGTTPEKLTGWESKAQYEEYRAKKQGEEEASVIKMYSQLTHGHKKAVRLLIKELLSCQEK